MHGYRREKKEKKQVVITSQCHIKAKSNLMLNYLWLCKCGMHQNVS